MLMASNGMVIAGEKAGEGEKPARWGSGYLDIVQLIEPTGQTALLT